mgnify:CR=1 FL=1
MQMPCPPTYLVSLYLLPDGIHLGLAADKIPSLEKVSKVVIDAAVIDGESEPLLMFENADASTSKAAAED